MVILDKILNKAAGKMRYPWLVFITTALFLLDLAIPDAIPLVDEILLGLAALLFSRRRERPVASSKEKNDNKDPIEPR